MTAESDIPEVFISIKGIDYHGILGSYCWNNICITKTMPSSLKDDVKKIQLQRNDIVDIHVKNFTNPEKFHLTVFLKGGAIIMNKDAEDKFDVNLQNGQYIINVLASWMYKGDVSYLFPVEIA
jgi:hypothetical protein